MPKQPASFATDGGPIALVWRTLVDRFRTSLFGVPLLWLIGAILGAQLFTSLDRRESMQDLPDFLDTTVDNARAILGAVSSGTISAASVVFSLTLVAIQMSSTSYSSRVLRNLLRDRFQQHMIGIVTATFLYSLLVLREVGGRLEDGGNDAYLPRISVFLAVVFAVGAVLALLASISHTAQKLRVSTVIRDLSEEVMDLVSDRFAERSGDGAASKLAVGTVALNDPELDDSEQLLDEGSATVVTAPQSGWVQQISIEALESASPASASIRIEAPVGSFVMRGAPLARLWSETEVDKSDVETGLRAAFGLGDERTMQQDVALGLLVLEDVAVKALSPGINDPNTAKAVIHQLGAVIMDILERDLPPGRFSIGECEIWSLAEPGYHDYVELAFDQIRIYARNQGPVQLHMVRTLMTVRTELHRRNAATPEADAAIDQIIDAVIADLSSPEQEQGLYLRRAVSLIEARS